MKHPAHVRALAELLCASNPRLKKLFGQLHERFVHAFVSMYVDANLKSQDSHQLNDLVEMCNRYVKRLQSRNEKIKQLDEENKKLKDQVKKLQEDKENRNEQENPNIVKAAIIETVANKFNRENYDAVRFEKYQKIVKELNQKIESLNAEITDVKNKLGIKEDENIQMKRRLEIKESDNKVLQETIDSLKTELDKIHEKSQNVTCTAQQTEPAISMSNENRLSEYEGQQLSSSSLSSPNSSDGDETGEETYTQTIEHTEVTIRRETYVPALGTLPDLPQTFEDNAFMASFQPPMTTSSMNYATPASTSFLAPSNFMGTPTPPTLFPMTMTSQGPIFLDPKSSASFLDVAAQETNSNNNMRATRKTYTRRKKRNA